MVDFSFLDKLLNEARVTGGDLELPQIAGINALNRTNIGGGGSEMYKIDPDSGLEVFLPVTITYPQQVATDVDGNPIELNSVIELPYCVVAVSARKRIIDTDLTDRPWGSVMEMVNPGNYEITVKGWLINQVNEYPEAAAAKLRQLWEKQIPVQLDCVVTDVWLKRPERGGSNEVVLKELLMPEVRGVKNVRPFEIKMVSNVSFNLIKIVK